MQKKAGGSISGRTACFVSTTRRMIGPMQPHRNTRASVRVAAGNRNRIYTGLRLAGEPPSPSVMARRSAAPAGL
jgi:hypothetical protein